MSSAIAAARERATGRPLVAKLDRRLEGISKTEPGAQVGKRVPPAHNPGHGNGQGATLRETPVASVHRIDGQAGWCRTARVDSYHAPIGPPDERKQVTSHGAVVGVGDGEGHCSGQGSIDSVATCSEGRGASLACRRMGCGDGPGLTGRCECSFHGAGSILLAAAEFMDGGHQSGALGYLLSLRARSWRVAIAPLIAAHGGSPSYPARRARTSLDGAVGISATQVKPEGDGTLDRACGRVSAPHNLRYGHAAALCYSWMSRREFAPTNRRRRRPLP